MERGLRVVRRHEVSLCPTDLLSLHQLVVLHRFTSAQRAASRRLPCCRQGPQWLPGWCWQYLSGMQALLPSHPLMAMVFP